MLRADDLEDALVATVEGRNVVHALQARGGVGVHDRGRQSGREGGPAGQSEGPVEWERAWDGTAPRLPGNTHSRCALLCRHPPQDLVCAKCRRARAKTQEGYCECGGRYASLEPAATFDAAAAVYLTVARAFGFPLLEEAAAQVML